MKHNIIAYDQADNNYNSDFPSPHNIHSEATHEINKENKVRSIELHLPETGHPDDHLKA